MCANPCGNARVKNLEESVEEKSRWNQSLTNDNYLKLKNTLDDYHMKILEDKLASIQWLEDPLKSSGGSITKSNTGLPNSYACSPSKSPISGIS